jgi:hypothetical protein
MSPVLVLLLVTHAEGRAIPTGAIERAIVDVLRPATILVEEVGGSLPDEEAAERGRDLDAAVVFRVAWEQLAPPVVALRTWTRGRATDAPWIARRLAFEDDDSLAEIGRTIGLAAATMVPQYGRRARDGRPVVAGSAARVSAGSPVVLEHVASPPVPPHAVLIDLLGGANLTDGGSLAWGGALRTSWTATRWLRPTMALTGSTDYVDAAQSRVSQLGFCVGGVLTLAASSRASLALRAEAEAVLQTATHSSPAPGQAVRRSRWLPALAPAVEATVAMSSAAALVLAAGYEIAAGHTDLYVGGDKTATIPAARATAALGVRVRF